MPEVFSLKSESWVPRGMFLQKRMEDLYGCRQFLGPVRLRGEKDGGKPMTGV